VSDEGVELRAAPFQISIGDYTLIWAMGRDAYNRHLLTATVVEEMSPTDGVGQVAVLAVHEGSRREPVLLIGHGYTPRGHDAIQLGALLVPGTRVLFVGTQDLVVAYDLGTIKRLWRERVTAGFLDWQRHGAYVVMSAGMELAVWDLYGSKQWSTCVEPPYGYTIAAGMMRLTAMGVTTSFSLVTGPSEGTAFPCPTPGGFVYRCPTLGGILDSSSARVSGTRRD